MKNDSTQFIITVDSTYITQKNKLTEETHKIIGSVLTSLWAFGFIVTVMVFTMKNK